ncbi:type IV pilin protein [Thermodesulfobacteriota bacterium]
MKTINFGKQSGFSIIEILMVMVIIGALASIAIPQYASYQVDAKSISCHSNRRNIEMDERSHYLDNGSPNLNIDERYSCPQGGTYVWLVSDPDDPDYPKIGCSLHFAGMPPSEDPLEELELSEEPGAEEETVIAEEEPEVEKTVSELIDDLITLVNNADIKKTSIKNQLVKNLKKADKEIDKNNSNKAIKNLNLFIKKVEKEEGKNIKADDVSLLISNAEAIISMV